MGRQKSKAVVESHELSGEQTPGLTRAAEAISQLPALESQLEANVRAVAAQVGYQLPADCTDPDLIQRDISANMRRSVEACLEVGRGLAVLKAACGHGNFVARLDVLGIDKYVASRFMQSAAKFSKLPSNATLTRAIGNQTKLFEMLVLDDEQIEELELTGQTGDLHLDEIATMSVKELRTALREAREESKAETDALHAVIRKKDEKLNSLDKQLHKLQNRAGDWHPRATEIAIETTRHAASGLEALDKLDTMRDAILTEEFGDEDREAAIEAMAMVYYDALNQVVGRVAELMHACEEVFIGYKEKARPMLDVEAFMPKPAKAAK
jgi:hypothetical protein